MLQYKTTCIPSVPYKGVKKREFYSGLTVDTANRAIAPVGQAIEAEGRGGWTLHSIDCLPQRIIRKKTIGELIFGWIPILGRLLCGRIGETREGMDVDLYVLVFVRES